MCDSEEKHASGKQRRDVTDGEKKNADFGKTRDLEKGSKRSASSITQKKRRLNDNNKRHA